MPTKLQLQQKIDTLEEYIAKIEKERAKAAETAAPVKELAQIKKYERFYADNMAEQAGSNARLKAQAQALYEKKEPNRPASALEAENLKLKTQVAEMTARAESYKRTIKFLEQLLDGDENASITENPQIPVIGRPKEGSVETDRLARKLRRDGYSIREIAERTGYSIGKTAGITQSVKITDEIKSKQKAHRAENRKKAKAKA